MKNLLKLTAAALAAITAMSCASLTSFADKLKTVDGTLYRYSDSGEQKGKYTGWVKTSKGRYYYKNGKMIKNKWLKLNGQPAYYLGKNGRAMTGPVYLSNGALYHFDDNGKLKYRIRLIIDEITKNGIKARKEYMPYNDGPIFTMHKYGSDIVKQQDEDGNWSKVPPRDPDEFEIGYDDWHGFVHEDESDFPEVTDIKVGFSYYADMESGRKYRLSTMYQAGNFVNELYVEFTYDFHKFTDDELVKVYEYLFANRGEFGIDRVYVDYEINAVVVQGNSESEKLKEYRESFEHKSIIIFEKKT